MCFDAFLMKAERKKFKCPNYLQTHQEYLQYEYSKFRLGFEFIRVSHFNAFWSVLMHSDVFWPVLIDVLKSFGKMYDNMNSGQKVHLTNTSKIPALWIPKVKVLQYRLKQKGNFMLTKVLNSWMFLHNAILKIIEVLQIQC